LAADAHREYAVKDTVALSLVKRLVRLFWLVDGVLRRVLIPRRRWRYWRLEGTCNACGSCCVEPSIHVGPITWHLPLARQLLVAWHARINGFMYDGQDEKHHELIFRCTHYQPTSQRCDSYASRPSMCRDYPRTLLAQAWPELFPSCGYRVRLRKAEQLRRGIEATSLSPEAKAQLRRKLRID